MDLEILTQDSGSSIIEPKSLEGLTYLTSSACMSVWADGLSWANKHTDKVVKEPEKADNLVVLSCQVTDLAILNDFRILERLKLEYPGKNYFISGCLSKRTDIEIPEFSKRLETPREPYEFIWDKSLVSFEKPFWVKDFNEEDGDRKDGHLFRDMYPLRIGKGCPNKCTYCTIRVTRGDFKQYSASKLEEEFLTFDNVLLVADSPTVKQIKDWYEISKRNNKGFSIRNVEPSVTLRCRDELLDLADNSLLKVYHSPIQSSDPRVLKDMDRNVKETLETIEISKELKNRGVYIATNIIIDYKDFNQDFSKVYDLYDYVSWNPLWDNVWDRDRAEMRFEKYMSSDPMEVRDAIRKA
ncbi:radical SAM protein [Candidatus Pacearchaeota archaeon]|nr:radical SAM protein [Candidatus Pacearchaeota archaeon]